MIMMKKLSYEGYEKACSFVENHARPIDRKYHSFWKGEAQKEEVLNELEGYRNEDGGFGHELEPDFRLDASSPMATTVAFQYMYKLGVPRDHKFVREGLHYFMNTFQDTNQQWQGVPEAVNHVPHAPWWHVGTEEVRYTANPDAEIIGYLLYYGDHNERTTMMLSRVMSHLDNLNEYEIHEVLCYLRLGKLAGGEIEKKINDKIQKKLPYIVDRPEEWDHYGVQPVVLVDSDQSPFAKELNQELHVNLDYIIEKQLDDGSWEPSWEWGKYEDTWAIAKEEWKGFLTVQHLTILSQFGRIERSSV